MALGKTGSAAIQGQLWGGRAHDWAEAQEAAHRPLYEAVLRTKAFTAPNAAVLDIGCGSGLFCAMAARKGAKVAGLDAAESLLDIARKRVPDADLRLGEMEELPFADASFDVVTGFNSFQYAANPVNALREAGRVGKRGAALFMATWGKPEDCQAVAYLAALRELLPPPPPGAPGPFALSGEGALEALVKEAGLNPEGVEAVDMPFVYPDLETALRGLLSAGPAVKAIATSGEERVRAATAGVLGSFRTASGGYRMENKFLLLTASAR